MDDPARSIWQHLGHVPHRVSYVTADGVRTRVVEAGEGADALLLLHGTGGHLEAFARNIGPLAKSRRTIAYDLPAHGWSDGPERSYEIKGYVAHLKALMAALGVERASFIGQSLGGWIAARLAIDEPCRVDRLVLVGTGGATEIPSVMALIRDSSREAVGAGTEDAVRRRLAWLFSDSSALPDELVEVRRAIYAQSGGQARMEKALSLQDPVTRRRNLIPPDEWARIASPTLVVWGESDQTAPVDVGEAVASWIPGAVFLPVPNSGHWPQFERSEAFNKAAIDFLSAKE